MKAARCPWCNRPAHVDDCQAKLLARRLLDEIAERCPLASKGCGDCTPEGNGHCVSGCRDECHPRRSTS